MQSSPGGSSGVELLEHPALLGHTRVSPLRNVRSTGTSPVYCACKNGRVGMGKSKEKKQMRARFRGKEFNSVISSSTSLCWYTRVEMYRERWRSNFSNLLTFLYKLKIHKAFFSETGAQDFTEIAHTVFYFTSWIYLCRLWAKSN